jgi:glycosyltransferase involved in cell wall biosynthesis
MFHIGEIPWKPSLLLIAYLAFTHFRGRRFSEIGPAAPIVLLASLLIVFTILGALAHWYVGGPMPAGETIRLIAIFALIPLSFIVGFSNTRTNHVYIGWIIVVMVAINLLLYVIPEQLGLLVTFYDLDAAYELSVYDPNSPDSRPIGIFQNSNISALAITVLMTYMALGIRWGFFRTTPIFLALFLSSSLFGVLMLLGRTQLASAIPIFFFIFFWTRGKHRIATAVAVLVVLLATGIIPSPIGPAVKSAIRIDIGDRMTHQVNQVVDAALITSFSTPTPVSTATVAPTTTIAATPTTEPTETAEPSPVPEPTETTEPSPVPEPTETAEPSPVPEPTETTEPSPVPEPTETAEPSPVPEPTETTEPIDNSYKVLFSPIRRPFISWNPARDRITDPPWMLLTGTGPEDSPKHGPISYHNDWISMLVSGGIAGIVTYTTIVAYFAGVSLFLAFPFFLPGVVNSFVFSPQFVILVSLLAGIVVRHKKLARDRRAHELDVVFVAVDNGLSIDNSPVLRAQVLDTASRLNNKGYKVGILANIEGDRSETLEEFGQHLQETRTVHSRSLPMMLVKSAWKLNRLDSKHSIRTLYVRGIWGTVIARLAFPTYNGPELVYDFRGDVVAEAQYSGTKGMRLVILRTLTQLAIRSATKHLSVSTQGATKLIENYGVRSVSVIPSSTDTHRFDTSSASRSETRKQLGFSDDDIVYAYAGGLARYQMIPEMLETWSKLNNRNAKFMFLTSKQPGNNINISEYDSLIPAGTIVLSLDPNEVPAYLAAADVGFLLREQDPLNTVASPVKFAEYLAAGLAVVTSPALSDASAQVTDHNLGVVISPTPDVNELQSLIEFTKTFPDQQSQVRSRAINLAQTRYDWDAQLDTWHRDVFDSQQSVSDD